MQRTSNKSCRGGAALHRFGRCDRVFRESCRGVFSSVGNLQARGLIARLRSVRASCVWSCKTTCVPIIGLARQCDSSLYVALQDGRIEVVEMGLHAQSPVCAVSEDTLILSMRTATGGSRQERARAFCYAMSASSAPCEQRGDCTSVPQRGISCQVLGDTCRRFNSKSDCCERLRILGQGRCWQC